MKRLLASSLGAAVAALGACSDGVLHSDRVLGSIELSHEAITATEGDVVPLTVRVLDQRGVPFENLPPWVDLQWTSTDESLVSTGSGEVRAVEPGQATVSVQVAERSTSARVRVNPEQVTVRVEGMQLTQSVQRQDGSIPLVAGRDGFLRIFVTADQPNFFAAGIRVRLFHGTDLRQTWTLAAPAESVPTVASEAELLSTWNVYVPSELIRPGLGIRVDADPEGSLPTTDDSRLAFPGSGEPASFDVRELPPLRLQLIPITDAHRATGNVTVSNQDRFVDQLWRMFPVGELEVVVRDPPFVTPYPAEFLDDWLGILYQLAALRAAEGSSDMYYGVVRRARGNLNGLGFLGYPVALGFDALPEAGFTLVHELGHNFGQLHTPCGSPSNIDPRYPHPLGNTGVFGYDLLTEELKRPELADIMGYCDQRWVSDYIYERVLDFRIHEDHSIGAPTPAEPGLLVWGRIDGRGLHLEPAFEVHAPPLLPRTPGPYSLEGRGAAGGNLFSFSFSPITVPHADADEGFFVFVVPLGAEPELRSIHLRGRGLEALREAAVAGADLQRVTAGPAYALQRRPTGMRISWQAERHPMVMVRDPASGRVLAMGRAGALELPGVIAPLELVFSDGVRSTRVLARPQ